MKKSEFSAYLDKEINTAQGRISSKGSKSDKVDSGRVEFLTALKDVVDGKPQPKNVGVVGALNDVLQTLGLLSRDKTLLSGLEL
jgi:hypothetical protein